MWLCFLSASQNACALLLLSIASESPDQKKQRRELRLRDQQRDKKWFKMIENDWNEGRLMLSVGLLSSSMLSFMLMLRFREKAVCPREDSSAQRYSRLTSWSYLAHFMRSHCCEGIIQTSL
jgi:hypothetical protein